MTYALQVMQRRYKAKKVDMFLHVMHTSLL